MIRLKQYLPAFIEIDGEPKVIVADSTSALLADPVIARFRDGQNGRHAWHRFSLADSDVAGMKMLMAEWDDGDYCWVIGNVFEGAHELQLPKWKETDNARRERERWNSQPLRYSDPGFPEQ